MKITPEIKQIDLSTLKECLKRIDSTLTDQKAVTAGQIFNESKSFSFKKKKKLLIN